MSHGSMTGEIDIQIEIEIEIEIETDPDRSFSLILSHSPSALMAYDSSSPLLMFLPLVHKGRLWLPLGLRTT